MGWILEGKCVFVCLFHWIMQYKLAFKVWRMNSSSDFSWGPSLILWWRDGKLWNINWHFKFEECIHQVISLENQVWFSGDVMENHEIEAVPHKCQVFMTWDIWKSLNNNKLCSWDTLPYSSITIICYIINYKTDWK